MTKKYALVLLVLLSCFSIAFADIGPSPSFSFTISNAEDFPDYQFYYSGNIWPDNLEVVSGEVFVYKLNTHIQIYAVPKQLLSEIKNPETISGVDRDALVQESIVSSAIDLQAGETSFEVGSFNPGSGSMDLVVKTNKSDADNSISPLLLIGVPVFLVIAGLIVWALFLRKRQT